MRDWLRDYLHICLMTFLTGIAMGYLLLIGPAR